MIKQFLLNLLLSLVWVALTGHFNYPNFMFGYIIGFFILWLLARTMKSESDQKSYFYRVPKILMFILFFIQDMIKANIDVTIDILTPRLNINPGIIAYKHGFKTDFEITMFTNIVALSPGTMVVKVSNDKKTLYIHSLYLRDKEKFIKRMKNGLERKLIEILR